MSEKIERNCLAAATLFIGAVVVDGLTAIDPAEIDESPASMRCTAVVLIACLGAPAIRQRLIFEQRVAAGVLLAVTALYGMHQGSVGVRTLDAVYMWLVLSLTLYSFATGGIEDVSAGDDAKKRGATSKDAPPYTFRESSCSLAMAVLFYSGVRIMRQGFAHSEVARNFKVSGTAWDGSTRETTGYAAASVATTIALTFGGAVATGLAAVLFASNDLREVGTGAKKELLMSAAFMQLLAAFFGTVSWSEQYTGLTAVWSETACDSLTCPAAGMARRTALMNSCPVGIWMNALGTAVLAYAPDARVRTREDEKMLSPPVVAWGMFSIVGCVLITVAYSSFSGAGSYIDYAMLIALVAVAISAFWDTWYGSVIFLVAIGIDEVFTLMETPAIDLLTYYTHCSLLVSFVLLSLRVAASSVTEFFWSWLPEGLVEIIDDIVGLLTIAGTSVAVALYLGSCVLMASYPGNWVGPDGYEQPDNKYARTWISAILEHWIPVLIWLPMYVRKQEVSQVAQLYRLIAWMSAVLVVVIVWVVSLAVAAQPPNHAMWAYSGPFLFGGISVLLPPWIAISFV